RSAALAKKNEPPHSTESKIRRSQVCRFMRRGSEVLLAEGFGAGATRGFGGGPSHPISKIA
ncbi:MAG TPA: hypothetical protein VFC45_08905, partial [Pseudolabrys sp.]|nr:hypothetical protein [Pseudolabrys sp.]